MLSCQSLSDAVEEELQLTRLVNFVDRHKSTSEQLIVIVYENQRKNLFYGWGKEIGIYLFPPFDRDPYSDDSGHHSTNGLANIRPISGYQWTTEWMYREDPEFEYADNWPNLTRKPTVYERPTSFVRRKQWSRTMKPISFTGNLQRSDVEPQYSTFYPYILTIKTVKANLTPAFSRTFTEVVFEDVVIGKSLTGIPAWNCVISKNIVKIKPTAIVRCNVYSEKSLTLGAPDLIGHVTFPCEHIWGTRNKKLAVTYVLLPSKGQGTIDVEIELKTTHLFKIEPIMGEYTNRSEFERTAHLLEADFTSYGASRAVQRSLTSAAACTDLLTKSDGVDVLADLRDIMLSRAGIDLTLLQGKSKSESVSSGGTSTLIGTGSGARAVLSDNTPSKQRVKPGGLHYASFLHMNPEICSSYNRELKGHVNRIAAANYTEYTRYPWHLRAPTAATTTTSITSTTPTAGASAALFPQPSRLARFRYNSPDSRGPFELSIHTITGLAFPLRLSRLYDYASLLKTLCLVGNGDLARSYQCVAQVWLTNGGDEIPHASTFQSRALKKILSKIPFKPVLDISLKRANKVDRGEWKDVRLTVNEKRSYTISWEAIGGIGSEEGSSEAAGAAVGGRSMGKAGKTGKIKAQKSKRLSLSSSTILMNLSNVYFIQLKHSFYMPFTHVVDLAIESAKLTDPELASRCYVDVTSRTGQNERLTAGRTSQISSPRGREIRESLRCKVHIDEHRRFLVCDKEILDFENHRGGLLKFYVCFGGISESDRLVQSATLPLPIIPKVRDVWATSAVIDDEEEEGGGGTDPAVPQFDLLVDQEDTIEIACRSTNSDVRLFVLEARDVLGVDSSGMSDVYYQIYLLDSVGNVLVPPTVSAPAKKSLLPFTGSILSSTTTAKSTAVYRSPTDSSTRNPVWEMETLLRNLDGLDYAAYVLVELWDENAYRSDECLGEICLSLFGLAEYSSQAPKLSLPIQPSAKMKKKGLVAPGLGTLYFKIGSVSRDGFRGGDGREDLCTFLSVKRLLLPIPVQDFEWPAMILLQQDSAAATSGASAADSDSSDDDEDDVYATGGNRKARIFVDLRFDGLALLAVFPSSSGSSSSAAKRAKAKAKPQVIYPHQEILGNCVERLTGYPSTGEAGASSPSINDSRSCDVLIPWEQVNVSGSAVLSDSMLMIEATVNRKFSSRAPGGGETLRPVSIDILVGPCAADSVFELLELRASTIKFRRSVMSEETNSTEGLQQVALGLLEQMQISSDGMTTALGRREEFQALGMGEEGEGEGGTVGVRKDDVELVIALSRFEVTLRKFALQKLRFQGYFGYIIDLLSQRRDELVLARHLSDVMTTRRIEKCIDKISRQKIPLVAKVEEMMFSMRDEVSTTLLTEYSTNVAKEGPFMEAVASRLTCLVHSYYTAIAAFLSECVVGGHSSTTVSASIRESRGGDARGLSSGSNKERISGAGSTSKEFGHTQGKLALLELLISKDDWIDLLVSPFINACELKFTVRPLLSWTVNFDLLVNDFSMLLNAEIQRWEQRALDQFIMRGADESTRLTPWEISDLYQLAGASASATAGAGAGVTVGQAERARTLYLSNIPESIQEQLRIQIGAKKIRACTSISEGNYMIVKTINTRVATAVATSYLSLAGVYLTAVVSCADSLMSKQATLLRAKEIDPSQSTALTQEEEKLLQFLIAAANDSMRVLFTHIPQSLEELYTKATMSEGERAFENAIKAFKEVSARSLSMLADYVYHACGDLILSRFDEQWLPLLLEEIEAREAVPTLQPVPRHRGRERSQDGSGRDPRGRTLTPVRRRRAGGGEAEGEEGDEGDEEVVGRQGQVEESGHADSTVKEEFYDDKRTMPPIKKVVDAERSVAPIDTLLATLRDFRDNVTVSLAERNQQKFLGLVLQKLVLRYFLFLRDTFAHRKLVLESMEVMEAATGVGVSADAGPGGSMRGSLVITAKPKAQSSDGTPTPRRRILRNDFMASLRSIVRRDCEKLEEFSSEYLPFEFDTGAGVGDAGVTREGGAVVDDTELTVHEIGKLSALDSFVNAKVMATSTEDADSAAVSFGLDLEATVWNHFSVKLPKHSADSRIYDPRIREFLGLGLSTGADSGVVDEFEIVTPAEFDLQVLDLACVNLVGAHWKIFLRVSVDGIVRMTRIKMRQREPTWEDRLSFPIDCVANKYILVEAMARAPFNFGGHQKLGQLMLPLSGLDSLGGANLSGWYVMDTAVGGKQGTGSGGKQGMGSDSGGGSSGAGTAQRDSIVSGTLTSSATRSNRSSLSALPSSSPSRSSSHVNTNSSSQSTHRTASRASVSNGPTTAFSVGLGAAGMIGFAPPPSTGPRADLDILQLRIRIKLLKRK